MHGVARSNVRGRSGGAEGESWSRRILLFIASSDSISESLVYAIEREFPWITVEQVGSVAAACTSFQHPVSLILLDTGLLPEVDEHAAELNRLHSSALVAVIQEDGRKPLALAEVMASRCVRGVLPMNLKLDVWLSVIRLMLRGGEYFPVTMLQSSAGNAAPNGAAQRRSGRPNGIRTADLDEFNELTDREAQILEMVSRGLQNKIIAATLHLSEHTVKIHLHNIITKLGAHNRTEAAAIFHDRREALHSASPAAQPPRATVSRPS
jgi:DNA-binding NarL/FixJ family response regulator